MSTIFKADFKSALFALLLFPLLAVAQEVKVISITDGDTVKVLTQDKQQIKVRLAEIDTPERMQPYGKKAKQALSSMVFGKTVDLHTVTIDRYGRTVGHLFVGSLNVNKEMVRTGNAWVYRRYMKDKSLLADEDYARANKLVFVGFA
ncbi:MAG: nuclease [Gammaproteobacteria bacterium]|nr:MAG: nuclease [Gammaproteobacteria bacterium]